MEKRIRPWIAGVLLTVAFGAASVTASAASGVSTGNSESSAESASVPSAESDDTSLKSQSAGTDVWTEIPEAFTVQYDDRFTAEDLLSESDTAESGDAYAIYNIETLEVLSFQVSEGAVTEKKDTDVLVLSDDSDTELIAAGVGTAVVYLVPEEQINGGSVTSGYRITVTSEPAPLTLMLLAGQSNMEGYCSGAAGYEPDMSVSCQEGSVYSTYAPSTTSRGKYVTGISFSEEATAEQAEDFVAGSLRGETSVSGVTLEYPINSLTGAGNGKTGPDSGLAYEWNQLTGDKVWVVNAASGGTSISNWVSGGSCYTRAKAVYAAAIQTCEAEIAAGHYTEGDTLLFWLQGESDCSRTASWYEAYFSTMYQSMEEDFDPDAIGIIMVRASTGSYTNEDELAMTGPRIAQYAIGAAEEYDNVYVVSNANEQWVSDSGVKSYFSSAYPSGTLSYPTHSSSSAALPASMNEIHSDIHYSQIGHNENGITAAQGMYTALYGDDADVGLLWKDADGKSVSSVTVTYGESDGIVVPVAVPVSLAKRVSVSVESVSAVTGFTDVVTYDIMTGTLSAVGVGTAKLTARDGEGNLISRLTVTGNRSEYDLSGVAGNYTGLYKYNGTYWYLIDGWIQPDYEGVEHNVNGWWYVKNGKVDFTYNGFAENKNGWWYIENGKVTFTKNSVIKDVYGKIGTAGTYWYVVGSKVQISFTGLADYPNANGWWYIENGRVTFTKNTVAKNKNGWYYVTGSKVQFGFTGLANYANKNGWWYITKGHVDFTKNTVAKNKNGWYYVTGGKVQFDFTGLANYANANGWWYIDGGHVDFSFSGIAQNKNGWWYLNGGKVIFDDALTYAARFVGAHTTSGSSDSTKLQACFSYMRSSYSYTRSYGIPTASDFSGYAVNYFKSGTGNCYSYASAFSCIAKVLGYEVRVVSGQIQSTSGGMTAHGWSEVQVNGTWYICDVNYNVYMTAQSAYPCTLQASNRYVLTVSGDRLLWS